MQVYTNTHMQIHSWSRRERAVIKAHWHITSRTHIKSLTISTQPNTKHTHTSGIDESKKSKFESRKRNLKFWSRISRVEREIWNSGLKFRVEREIEDSYFSRVEIEIFESRNRNRWLKCKVYWSRSMSFQHLVEILLMWLWLMMILLNTSWWCQLSRHEVMVVI